MRVKLAGMLVLLSGVVIMMGIITAESQYPTDIGYSTVNNEISDLGATRPPDSIITQPSATIFNVTMLAAGGMLATSAVALMAVYRRRVLPYALLLLGVGIFAVGVFPGNNATIHPNVAMLTFVSGGVTGIAAFRVIASPLRFVSLLMGATTLVFLFGAGAFIPLMGDGGTERWVAYPVVLWMVAFGGYLLGRGTDGSKPQGTPQVDVASEALVV
jgi:hypothetical membrane protein